jgi:hypothetical protein
MTIMTLYSQYIYSLVSHTITHKNLFNINNEIHKYKCNNNNNLHLPVANLSKLNTRSYASDMSFFNSNSQYIKDFIANLTKVKSTLNRFLYHYSLYSLNEYSKYKEAEQFKP